MKIILTMTHPNKFLPEQTRDYRYAPSIFKYQFYSVAMLPDGLGGSGIVFYVKLFLMLLTIIRRGELTCGLPHYVKRN